MDTNIDLDMQMLAAEIQPLVQEIQAVVKRYAKPGNLEQIAVIIADRNVREQVIVWHSGDSADILRMLDQAQHAEEYSR